jgi:hypothetical protein
MLNRWIRSLSARLWVTSVAALALSMTVLVTLVVYSFNRFPEQTIGGHEQMERAGDVVDGLQFDGAGHPVSVRPLEETAWLFEVVSTELKYRVLDERGNVLLASGTARDGDPWIAGDLSGAVGKMGQVTIGSKSFEIVTLPVTP